MMKKPKFLQEITQSAANDGDMASYSTGGAGMDRRLAKKKWPPRKIATVAAASLFGIAVIYGIWSSGGGSRLNVERDKLTISTVTNGVFKDFIPVVGTLEPIKTVFLDAIEGGRVEQISSEEGTMVDRGDPILKLSNNNLQLDLLNREAQLYEQINFLRQTRLDMERNSLNLRQQLAEIGFQYRQFHRQAAHDSVLLAKQLISEDQFAQSRDERDYWLQRRELTLLSQRQDSLLRVVQIEQLETSVERMQRNLDVVRENLENLTVKAPIAGQLTSLHAEIGQSIAPGQRIGQVDVLDGFKVEVPIDEHYLARVKTGQQGDFSFAGEDYHLEIIKVYPEVVNGRFEVDMHFAGAVPAGIRRGQTLRIRLELSDPSTALLLARGGFYQTTGGNWAFVLAGDGNQAVRRNVHIGRQNTDYFEVLDGLAPGDQVITSSYENFGNVDILVLK